MKTLAAKFVKSMEAENNYRWKTFADGSVMSIDITCQIETWTQDEWFKRQQIIEASIYSLNDYE